MVIASLWQDITGLVFDIDRISARRVGDYYEMTFTTTTLRSEFGERLVDLKVKLYNLLDVPVKIVTIKEKKKIMDNPVFAQYDVKVTAPVNSRLLKDKAKELVESKKQNR